MTHAEQDRYRRLALPHVERAGLYLTEAEKGGLEVADLRLGEFSARSCDESDLFTDPEIRRLPELDG